MNNNELFNLLKELLRLQSFDPLKSEVPDFIITTLKQFGIKPKIINSNGFKSIVAKTEGEPKVIFNGHWDTVLPNENFRSEYQKIKSDKGYIYGLGACDMKSGVAALIAAFIQANKENISGVMINIVPDEELGGQNGTNQLVKKGFIAPNIVICEPTNLNISLGQKGALFTKVKAFGISGHGAYPNKGENAILKIINFANKLSLKYPLPKKDSTNDEVFEMVTASVNVIKGGSVGNVIPDLAEAEVDVRVPPKVNLSSVQKNLEKIAKECEVQIEFDKLGSGWELNRKSKLFETSTEALNQTGVNVNYVRKMGSNDGRYYVKAKSNIVNIGPGDNKLSHTINEKVSKNELVQAKQIYLLISKILCK